MTPADQIASVRRSILENMAVGRAIAMRGRQIFNVVSALTQIDYDFGLFRKDLLYLREKGYLRINARLSGKRANHAPEETLGPRWYLDVFWELSAAGLEIAQRLTTDPALEF